MSYWADAVDKQVVIFKTLTGSILILAWNCRGPWSYIIVCGLVHYQECYYGIKTQTGGSNVGLDRLNILWQGYSGLKFLELLRKQFFLTQYEESPYYMFIHFGVNDVGAFYLYTLTEKIKTYLRFNKVRFSKSLFSNTMWKIPRLIIHCLVYNIGVYWSVYSHLRKQNPPSVYQSSNFSESTPVWLQMFQ